MDTSESVISPDSIGASDQYRCAELSPREHYSRDKRLWALVAAALVLVILLLNFKIVFGFAAARWDGEDFWEPLFDLIGAHARQGRLLIWDPWILGGSPDFADPQESTLSPLTILFSSLSGGTEPGFRAYWLLLWCLGPLGVLALARYLRSPAWAGFVVALGWAFCGIYTGLAELISGLYALAFLPFALWRLDASLKSRRLFPAIQAGALWGLSAIGGYPALTILSGCFFFLWSTGRAWFADSELGSVSESRPTIGFALLAVMLLCAVGILVLSPAYMEFFLQTRGFSDRVNGFPRFAVLSQDRLTPGTLASIASPYLHTLKAYNPQLWKYSDLATATIYVGVMVTILAAYAMIARRKLYFRYWLAAVAAFFLACALGGSLPVRGWLYDVFWPSRFFVHSSQFRIYFMFIAAILALMGANDLAGLIHRHGSSGWKRFAVIVAIISSFATLGYEFQMQWIANKGPDMRWSNLHVLVLWPLAALIGIAALHARFRRFIPAAFVAMALLDATAASYLARSTTYDTGGMRAMWNRLNRQRNSNLDLTSNGLSRDIRAPLWTGTYLQNRNVPLRIPTLQNFVALQNRFLVDLRSVPVLQQAAVGSERIWFSPSAPTVTPDDAVFKALAERSQQLGAPVLVLHNRSSMVEIYKPGEQASEDSQQVSVISALPPAQRLHATIIHYRPNRLAFSISAPDDGWLLVTDRWARGWEATVNGLPAEVLGGDFLFRAIHISAGNDIVSFEYRPEFLKPMLTLSWGTLAVVLALSLLCAKRLGFIMRLAWA
jgi:hypothetical protein